MPTKKPRLARRVWVNRYQLRGSEFCASYDEMDSLERLPGLLVSAGEAGASVQR